MDTVNSEDRRDEKAQVRGIWASTWIQEALVSSKEVFVLYARVLSATALLLAAFAAPVGPTAGLLPEVTVTAPGPLPPAKGVNATAFVSGDPAGLMPEIVVCAAGPEMVLPEVEVIARSPEHLRGVMPEVVVRARGKTSLAAENRLFAGRPQAF